MATLLANPLFAFAIIILVSCLIFGRSLGSFFLADDIGEVRYVSQIFAGDWNLFWSNFSGNYMQVPNMSVYRPILLLTLMVDYLFWRGNALGYFLSNLVYFTGSACLLYVFIKQICAGFGKARASLCALAAAVLFACNPLHCESISWIVGRVDSACCMFYLAALVCFMSALKKASFSRLNALVTIVFFAMAICTKEMAIGFAPTTMLLAFLFGNELGNKQGLLRSLKERLLYAWRFSALFWYATAAYFLVRFLALGTILGGYKGSVGATQTANAISRWLDLDTWNRLFFPFPQELFANGHSYEQFLAFAYTGLAFLLLFRLCSGSLPWKHLFFFAFWALTQAAPIYRLFGLGFNLEGARFCFFLTLTLSSLMPVLLLAPNPKLPQALSTRLAACSLVLLAAIAFVCGKAAYATNLLWLHAGKEVRAVLHDGVRIASGLKPAERVILLGLPKEHAGAHMILNGSTLQMLLSPPFTDKAYFQPFLTFGPILFGDESLVNGSSLRKLINQAQNLGPYIWSNQKKTFVEVKIKSPNFDEVGPGELKIPISTSSKITGVEAALISTSTLGHAEYSFLDGALNVKHPQASDRIDIKGLNLNPLAFTYLKMSFRSSNNEITLPFSVSWKGAKVTDPLPELADSKTLIESVSAAPDLGDKQLRTVFIPLGRNWRWYAQPEITELSIGMPGLEELSICELSLLSDSAVCPSISCPEKSNNLGVYSWSPEMKLRLRSEQGESLLLQLSKKEFFFDNLKDESSLKSGLQCEFRLPGKEAGFKIPQEKLQGQGYYQLRACALDSRGNQLGTFSDPITIHVGD